MTGRAAGFCAGYDTPGYAQPAPGRGFFGGGGGFFGFGRGRGGGGGGGRGWRNWFYATGLNRWQRTAAPFAAPDPAQQADALKEQANRFEAILENIRQRIENLEQQANK